jgi:hypothetical protein
MCIYIANGGYIHKYIPNILISQGTMKNMQPVAYASCGFYPRGVRPCLQGAQPPKEERSLRTKICIYSGVQFPLYTRATALPPPLPSIVQPGERGAVPSLEDTVLSAILVSSLPSLFHRFTPSFLTLPLRSFLPLHISRWLAFLLPPFLCSPNWFIHPSFRLSVHLGLCLSTYLYTYLLRTDPSIYLSLSVCPYIFT